MNDCPLLPCLLLGFLEEARCEGSTVVLVTHDPQVAARAGRQLRLADGQVLADGSRRAAAELAAAGI